MTPSPDVNDRFPRQPRQPIGTGKDVDARIVLRQHHGMRDVDGRCVLENWVGLRCRHVPRPEYIDARSSARGRRC